MDATDRKVRGIVYGMVADAYRDGRPPGVDPLRELGEFCSCGHHTDEHHGKQGELHCSADGCGCPAFDPLTAVECPRCGDCMLRSGDTVCGECGHTAEEIAAGIARARAPKTATTLSGDDTAGSPEHNRKA
jgi:hypothetical protein